VSQAIRSEPTATPIPEQSLGELFATTSRSLSILVNRQIELAKAELAVTVRKGGIGAALLGAAAFLALFAVVFLSVAAAFGIAGLGIPNGYGFLIVGGLYLLVAIAAGLIGVNRFKRVQPPQRSISEAKASVEWAKHPTTAPAVECRRAG
jgi:small-conductance mechanosensitive channel